MGYCLQCVESATAGTYPKNTVGDPPSGLIENWFCLFRGAVPTNYLSVYPCWRNKEEWEESLWGEVTDCHLSLGKGSRSQWTAVCFDAVLTQKSRPLTSSLERQGHLCPSLPHVFLQSALEKQIKEGDPCREQWLTGIPFLFVSFSHRFLQGDDEEVRKQWCVITEFPINRADVWRLLSPLGLNYGEYFFTRQIIL